jgi:predicted metal-dependent RNase
VKIRFEFYRKEIEVFANIVHVEELSARADLDELISWFKNLPKNPKKVFVMT